MQIGDYVRTIDEISRITDISHNIRMGDLVLTEDYDYIWYKPKEIIKTSPNILDLLEEGDLLEIEYYSLRYKERITRLFEVDYKIEEFMTLKNAHCEFMLRNNEFSEKDKRFKPIIKSIITKEQIEAMKYKVGDNK